MTIVEALKESRESGRTYSRASHEGYVGWIKFHATHKYHGLSSGDLMADDWIPTREMIEQLTKGRWTSAQDPS